MIGGILVPILIYFSLYFSDLKTIMLSIIFLGILVIAILLIFEFLRLRGKNYLHYLTEKIQRDGEKLFFTGIYYSIAVVLISFFVYFEIISFISYICALFIFGICDGTSTIFGILFGNHKLFYNKDKSYEGSFSFFIFALIIAFIFLRSFEKAFMIALFSMFVESLPNINDNLTLPIFTSLFIEFLVWILN